MKVLLAGESWHTHSIHIKGFDSFETASYHEGGGEVIAALEAAGIGVDYLPNHVASERFPTSAAALAEYSSVILSDIGANTLLLSQRTFVNSEASANRLHLLRDYVRGGGGLLMVGGYLTFQGIGGKGNYHGSAVEEVLPVRLFPTDDRCEAPQGVVPEIVAADHPVLAGLSEWPAFLGYNRSTLHPDATLVAKVGDDPFIAARMVGSGRSAVFASDCGPHWGPPPFLAWPGYRRLWTNLVSWLGER